MGVRKYGKRYRASIRVGGVDLQEYFSTQEAADLFIKKMEKKKLNAGTRAVLVRNERKRATARDQDLPVGFFKGIRRRPTANGSIAEYPFVCTVIVENGKSIGQVVTAYGRRHTFEQALALTIKKREKLVKRVQVERDKEQARQSARSYLADPKSHVEAAKIAEAEASSRVAALTSTITSKNK